MRVDLKKFKLEKAVSKNERRPALNSAYLDVENSVLIATDSNVLAVIPVELALDDTTGLVPVEALTLARKDQTKDEHAEIVANGRVSVRVRGERAEFDRADTDGFPDWKQFFKRGKKPLVTLALNPKLLAHLAEAVGAGSGAVKLDIYGPDLPIRVSALGDESGAKGIVMPVLLKDAA